MDGLAAKDVSAALLHTREAIRLAQNQKQVSNVRESELFDEF